MLSQSSIAGSRTPAAGSTGGTGRGPSFLEDGGPVGETRFIPDEVTNSIIVTTYPRVWTEVEGIIKKLDRMPRQVLIEVLAAEITLDDSTKLGLQWAIQHGRFSASLTEPPTLVILPAAARSARPIRTTRRCSVRIQPFTSAAGGPPGRLCTGFGNKAGNGVVRRAVDCDRRKQRP